MKRQVHNCESSKSKRRPKLPKPFNMTRSVVVVALRLVGRSLTTFELFLE